MRGKRLIVVIGLAVALFAIAGCGGDDEGTATDTDTTTETTDTSGTTGETTGAEELYGTVGPGFEISLTTEEGEPITTLPAGTYKIEVDDKADVHNFHLSGPGVDVSTQVSEVGKVDWDVDLQAGSYTYVCDPHASQMSGSFEVTG
jgi:plastocyanin